VWSGGSHARRNFHAPVSDRTFLFRAGLGHAPGRYGTERFATAWEAGRSLVRDVTPAEALAHSDVPPQPSPEARSWHGITGRELEVLRLLAAGETNRAIAETLFSSPTTTASHVASISSKLGVDSRAKATANAHR